VNAYRAHLLRAAESHDADGHGAVAYQMRWQMWYVRDRATLEKALRRVVDWDEATLGATLDAADAEARGGHDG
jgi:hypothetical protein